MKRESFRSRLGFLLVSAGCAIGIGNVWRFPYIAGKNGGGYFVLFYLLCLLVMGVPVLTMELAVGRASRRSAVLSYKTLEKPGQKWHIHGWFCLLGCYLLMMYYTTVSGWMVSYFGKFLTGAFHSGMSTDEVASAFGAMLSSPGEMALWAEVVVVAGFLVCSFGLQKGLERVTKVMMLCLLALILVLAVHSLTLSGAAEGMKFYLVPSMDSIRENGFGSLVTDAMNQAFFTLSPRHRRHGDLRQLHERRAHPARRSRAHLRARHLRGADGGHHHLPRLLHLRRDAGQRPLPDFPDPAARSSSTWRVGASGARCSSCS